MADVCGEALKRREPFPWGLIAAAVLATGLSLCCAGRPSAPATAPALIAPNVRVFPGPYDGLWRALIETVELRFLIPIEVAETNRGVFSSELIRGDEPAEPVRSRLSGNIRFDGKDFVVTLYRHTELYRGGRWHALPSNLELESRILSELSRKWP